MFTIALNAVKEVQYIEYVDKLIQKLLNKKPRRYYFKGNGNCVLLIAGSKTIVNELIRIGLKSGDKIKNQVDVPNWIKDNMGYSIACIKGLIDTDGCIFIDNRDRIGISFTNKSKPLLTFFEMF